jgi:hypothetical protein
VNKWLDEFSRKCIRKQAKQLKNVGLTSCPTISELISLIDSAASLRVAFPEEIRRIHEVGSATNFL